MQDLYRRSKVYSWHGRKKDFSNAKAEHNAKHVEYSVKKKLKCACAVKVYI